MAATEHAKQQKNDTREFITTAILQLLQKNQLSDLTISKVCTRAGISRMAFYRNFDSLDDVLHDYYHSKLKMEFDILNSDNDEAKLQSHQAYFDRFSDDLILAANRGFEHITQAIFISETEKFFDNVEDKYWVTFIATGTYSVWKKWILEGKKEPFEKIHQLIATFTN